MLCDALDDACAALAIPTDRREEREVIAARIVDLARRGVLDRKALSSRVLREANLQI